MIDLIQPNKHQKKIAFTKIETEVFHSCLDLKQGKIKFPLNEIVKKLKAVNSKVVRTEKQLSTKVTKMGFSVKYD